MVMFGKSRKDEAKLPLLSVLVKTYDLWLNVFNGWDQRKLISQDGKKPSGLPKIPIIENNHL